MTITWTEVEGASGIHDYEVGLSTNADSEAPDRLPFTSTKQHSHFRIPHPNVPQGTEFYVIIKAISRAGVESVTVR